MSRLGHTTFLRSRKPQIVAHSTSDRMLLLLMLCNYAGMPRVHMLSQVADGQSSQHNHVTRLLLAGPGKSTSMEQNRTMRGYPHDNAASVPSTEHVARHTRIHTQDYANVCWRPCDYSCCNPHFLYPGQRLVLPGTAVRCRLSMRREVCWEVCMVDTHKLSQKGNANGAVASGAVRSACLVFEFLQTGEST